MNDPASYDEIASNALEELLNVPGDNGLYERLERQHASKPELGRLWESTMTVPPWVDWTQLERGQLVFSRYLIPILVGFGFQGFVGEIAAAPGPAKVLNHTKGLSAGRIWPRVSRTLQWLMKATESVESIQPGGEGHKSTIRVRLIHALVRRGMPQNKKTTSGSSVVGVPRDKDVASCSSNDGVPFNSSDMILTLTFFCCNPMWKQLPRLWVYPTDNEKEDFVAFYRYIGYLLGVPTDSTDCLASAAQAEQTMIALHADRKPPSVASQKITRTFVEAVTDKPPYNLSEGFVNAGVRAMNPPSVCDDLMIGESGWLPHIAFMTLRGCVGLLALIQSAGTPLEKSIIKYLRKKLLGKLTLLEIPTKSKRVVRPKDEAMNFRCSQARCWEGGKVCDHRATPSISYLERPVEMILLVIFAVASGITLGLTGVIVSLIARTRK